MTYVVTWSLISHSITWLVVYIVQPVKAESLAGCPAIHRSHPHSTAIVFWNFQRRLSLNTTVYRQTAFLNTDSISWALLATTRCSSIHDIALSGRTGHVWPAIVWGTDTMTVDGAKRCRSSEWGIGEIVGGRCHKGDLGCGLKQL